MSEVRTTFTLTKEDLVRAGRAMRRRARDGRVFYMFLGLAAILVVGSGLTAKEGPRLGLILLQLTVLATMALVSGHTRG